MLNFIKYVLLGILMTFVILTVGVALVVLAVQYSPYIEAFVKWDFESVRIIEQVKWLEFLRTMVVISVPLGCIPGCMYWCHEDMF